jgi:hypothetical protein
MYAGTLGPLGSEDAAAMAAAAGAIGRYRPHYEVQVVLDTEDDASYFQFDNGLLAPGGDQMHVKLVVGPSVKYEGENDIMGAGLVDRYPMLPGALAERDLGVLTAQGIRVVQDPAFHLWDVVVDYTPSEALCGLRAELCAAVGGGDRDSADPADPADPAVTSEGPTSALASHNSWPDCYAVLASLPTEDMAARLAAAAEGPAWRARLVKDQPVALGKVSVRSPCGSMHSVCAPSVYRSVSEPLPAFAPAA